MSSVPLSIFWGDGEAFANLYREFHPRVFKLCHYILGSHEDAEDASSEVFARLPRSIRTYDRSLPFSRWISSVASHYCIDLLRRRKSESRWLSAAPVMPEHHASAGRSPVDHLLSEESHREILFAIARLPERYRAPLVLRYYDELSYEEIARQLRLSRSNAKTLVFRAKKEIKTFLTTPDR